MDYYLHKVVERVKKHRRSRQEITQDMNIDQNLHLAARNRLFNADPTQRGSVAPDFSRRSSAG
ncbi:hypothetical protein E4U42_001450 [Claviceps africana]|uniref:Uncharacterized protein n=1 Tax=Claviceps africana TaxID=83212 RepID=A0A8K0J1N9_9HYPO|nr:hypothetical protein E4U42_001450 [Claviceps africana]